VYIVSKRGIRLEKDSGLDFCKQTHFQVPSPRDLSEMMMMMMMMMTSNMKERYYKSLALVLLHTVLFFAGADLVENPSSAGSSQSRTEPSSLPHHFQQHRLSHQFQFSQFLVEGREDFAGAVFF